jgi:hypothetical protein
MRVGDRLSAQEGETLLGQFDGRENDLATAGIRR